MNRCRPISPRQIEILGELSEAEVLDQQQPSVTVLAEMVGNASDRIIQLEEQSLAVSSDFQSESMTFQAILEGEVRRNHRSQI